MRRREFITLVGGAAAAWPLAVRAQQGKVATIGFLGGNAPSTQSQWTAALVQRLREHGWIEGRNLVIQYRWAEGRFDRSPEIMAEFSKLMSLLRTEPQMSSQQRRRRRSFQSYSQR